MDDFQGNAFSAPQLTVGSVLGRTWAALFKNPVVFFGLAAAAVLPPALLEALMPQSVGWSSFMRLLAMVLGLVIQGAVAYAVYQALRDENAVSVGDAISHGLTRLPTLFLAALLVGLLVMVGLVLLIIPGIIVGCILAVTIQACVVEQLGPVESLKRSAELTKGYRLTIFFLVLIVTLAVVAVVFLVAFIAALLFGATLAGLLGAVIAVVPQAFSLVMSAIIYADLRAVKEGVTIDTLADVFD